MRSPFRKLVLAVLSLALVGVPVLGTSAAWAASPALDEAQGLYDGAKFEDAIAKLRDALSTGAVTGSDVIAARALMGRCLVKAGNRVEAKQSFKTVLRADPGFRLDPVTVPPDEMEVFNLAAKEIQQEQIEAGQRIPASLSFFFGTGSGENSEFAKLLTAGGNEDGFDVKPQFGGSVRFPISPRWSLDLQLLQFKAEGSDTFVVNPRYGFEATATSLAVSVYWTAMTGSKHRVYLFAGGGPLLSARGAVKFNDPNVGYFVADEGVGTFLHGGVEGEWMFPPRLSIFGSVSGRMASKSDLFKDVYEGLNLYSPDPNGELRGQEVDFSGYGAYIGLRGYIGY